MKDNRPRSLALLQWTMNYDDKITDASTDVAKCSCAFNATDGKLLKKAICRLFIKTSYAEMINNNIMNELSVMDSNQSCSLLKFF